MVEVSSSFDARAQIGSMAERAFGKIGPLSQLDPLFLSFLFSLGRLYFRQARHF